MDSVLEQIDRNVATVVVPPNPNPNPDPNHNPNPKPNPNLSPNPNPNLSPNPNPNPNQVRVEREAMDSVLEQIDRNVATVVVPEMPLPEMPVPPAALAHLSDHASTAALAATSSGGGGFPLIPVALVAIPALLYFVVLPR